MYINRAMARYTTSFDGRLSKQDAQLFGSFLESNFPDGIFTPEDVVKLARPKTSPIHEFFEWDDTVAAARWRIQQARQLISSIVVHIEDQDVKAFHSVVVNEHRGYMPVNQAMKAPDIWEQVISDALDDLNGWRIRYEKYKEFAPVIKAIDQVNKRSKTWLQKQKRQKKLLKSQGSILKPRGSLSKESRP